VVDDKEIEQTADEFKLRPIEVEKDYVYGWLLTGIFARPLLASQLVLKGGNALRKSYLLLFAIVLKNEYGVVRREVITTFLKKSIFEPNPQDARN